MYVSVCVCVCARAYSFVTHLHFVSITVGGRGQSSEQLTSFWNVKCPSTGQNYYNTQRNIRLLTSCALTLQANSVDCGLHVLAGINQHVIPGVTPTAVRELLGQDNLRLRFLLDYLDRRLRHSLPAVRYSSTLPSESTDLAEQCWSNEDGCMEVLSGKESTLKWQDLRRLRPGKSRDHWCNDELLNEYIDIIIQHRLMASLHDCLILNTFFIKKATEMDCKATERWIHKSATTQKCEINRVVKVVAPVHVSGIHWALLVVDFTQKTIRAEDSQGLGDSPEVWLAACRLATALGACVPQSEWLADGKRELARKLRLHYIAAKSNAAVVPKNLDGIRLPSKVKGLPSTGIHSASRMSSDDLSEALPSSTIWNLDAPRTWAPDSRQREDAVCRMRADCIEALRKSTQSDRMFLGQIHLADSWLTQDNVEETSLEEAADAYIQRMSERYRWGGHVELEQLARHKLKAPIIIYQHPGNDGEFQLSNIIGKRLTGLPVFLLRTRNAHYSLMIPSKETAYRDIHACALATVELQPLPLTLYYGPVLLQCDTFDVPGDGDCMFAALALMAHAQESCKSCNDRNTPLRWTRQVLPRPAKLSARLISSHQRLQFFPEIRTDGWGRPVRRKLAFYDRAG